MLFPFKGSGVGIVDALLLLLPLGADVAFASIIGICTIGFYVSYGIPIFLKLVFAWNSFPDTEMSLGPYSNICGIFACMWLFGTSTLLFLPPVSPVDEETMNWTVVVVGGFGFICLVYWFAYASKNFKGPTKKKGDMEIIRQ